MPDYTVLEGIRNAMAEEGDAPASDEMDDVQGQVCFAYGESGIRYVWIAETNHIHKFRPRPNRPGAANDR
jgi:hypothetical protein